MTFRITTKLTGLAEALDEGFRLVEEAVTGGVAEATHGLAEDLRDQTFKGLGTRLPYTWIEEVYPRGQASAGAAGQVHTKAPKIISFFASAKVHTPIGAAFAIPVRGSAPLKRGGYPMEPHEVERYFRARLEPGLLKSGHLGLFMDLVKARRGVGNREPTRIRLEGRKGLEPREKRPVLMFVLVRSLTSKKLIDLEGTAQRWGAALPGFIEKRLGQR